MNVDIDFDSITRMLTAADREGRDFLYEYEVYTLLGQSGAETPPQCRFIPSGARLDDDRLISLPGDRVVLKIVSPAIIHKTEVAGVRIVEKSPNAVRSAVRRMLYEVPENYAHWMLRHPGTAPLPYRDLSEEALISAVSRDVKGVLLVQFMPPDSTAFGNELIVGLRHTREFGTVISAGLGGTDTELYARRFRKGQAIVAASTAMNDGHSFFELFRRTISYRKLAGLTRGQRRIVTDEQLIECFESFIRMGNHFSQAASQAPFVIEELEINPFAFTDYLMVPLDGMCRFRKPGTLAASRPVKRIHALLHPKTIGIMGVSATRKNFGRIILDNILAQGFKKKNIVVFREDGKEIAGVPAVTDLDALARPLDLLVVAVGAKQVPHLVDRVIDQAAARSVMLIPGGMGETEESRDRAAAVTAKINAVHGTEDGGPVFLGANCMGVISRPGGYDTWFIPEAKLPKERGRPFHRAALISQSGAFMLHRSHQVPQLSPAYMISMGNQTDLTLGDMVLYFKDSDRVDVIAVYAEGFNDLDGLAFCRAVRHAVQAGKEVVFYKAGRTPEGQAATGSHTASLAGDYMVCESCVRQAGAIVARSFSEFQELLLLSETLSARPIRGNRLAAVTGAGFEAVGMADSIHSDDFHMTLARFEEKTKQRIQRILKEKKLDALVTLSNPLDINPAADDEAHVRIARALARDAGVDAVVVSLDPMSPATRTLAVGETRIPAHYDMAHGKSIRSLMIALVKSLDTPIIAVVDGGALYEPLRQSLMDNGVPVFTTCDKAVAALSLYIEGRLAADAMRSR